MKKIIIPLLAIFSMLGVSACKKKNDTNTKDNTTTKSKTKVTTKTNSTSNTQTTEYIEPMWVKLNFGDYNTYYVDDKYKEWQMCYEITSELFPFDLSGYLRDFKGWAYNGELIFDENGNKLKDVEVADSMIFDVVFESADELKLFDFSSGMSDDQYDIWGFANDDIDYRASITEIDIPKEIVWHEKTYKLYRIRGKLDRPGGCLVGCNNVKKLTIPYPNGINTTGFLSCCFGVLWGTQSFDNAYEVIQYYQPSSASSEYKEATYYIPKSLETIKVTGHLLDKYVFANYNALKDIELIITSNMKHIYSNAFYGVTETINIYFEGSISDFNNITVDSTGNDAWTNANVYFYSKEDPGDGGSYSFFHYDENGDIVLWN